MKPTGKFVSKQQHAVIDVLKRGGIWSTKEIMQDTGLKRTQVRSAVSHLRHKFLNDQFTHYIYITDKGYTFEETPENTVYESKLRMQIGFGVLVNGIYVFKRCKAVACKTFDSLNLIYKPKMLTVNKLIK